MTGRDVRTVILRPPGLVSYVVAVVLIWALLLGGGVPTAVAQTAASIFGTVTDDSGAVVSGAKILATNTLTNEVRNTTTNEVGNYTFPELPVGVYRILVEREGFKSAVREGIELSLNRNARVSVQLSLGSVTERISVTGDAPLVETSTNEMGGLVDQKRVADLPLNGRNTQSLVSLIPGMENLQTGNSQGFQENKVVANGQRAEDSSFLLDGGDNTSPLRNYGNDVPNPDAIQEFRVITNNYSAEYGRTVGAVVNIVTKSGTNQFGGTLFEFLRNRSFNARNFFQAATTPLVQNQFGGTFGGPVIKNKTFFFASVEAFRRRTSAFNNSALVPTVAQRAGDFSANVDRNGKLIVIKDPLTGQAFPNNTIPTNRLSPVAQNYLKLAVGSLQPIPLPNAPQFGPNALTQQVAAPTDNKRYLFKGDHLFSEKHKLTGSYFWSNIADGARFLTATDFIRRTILSGQQNLNLHEYWIISPTKLNNFGLTYGRTSGNRYVTPDTVSWADLGSKFAPLAVGPQQPPEAIISGYLSAGSPIGGPKTSDSYDATDTFSWTTGRHDLKFGAQAGLRKLMDVSAGANMGGKFDFNGVNTGDALGDFMLGLSDSLSSGAQQYKSSNQWYVYGFAQDKFRVTSKLALSLGVRYEVNTVPVHPLDQLIAWRPGRQSSCVPQAPSGILFPCDSGIPRGGIPNDLNNFAPRFGIVYDLFGDGKTVIRAGYGISYAVTILNATQDPQTSSPWGLSMTILNTTLEDPFKPIGGNPFPFLTDPAHLKFTTGAEYLFDSPNKRTGYVQQYNFSFQRQIGKDWSLEAAYVGNVGRKLLGGSDINSPMASSNATSKNIDQRRPLYPTFLTMTMTDTMINSSYNALQARVEKRFSRGFTLLASYTLGKWTDTGSWYKGPSWVDPRNRWLDKGLGDQDRRQMLVLSSVWQLPFYSKAAGLRRQVLGGWSINTIATFYAGQPVAVVSGKDNDLGIGIDHPDVVGAWKLDPSRSRQEVIQQWFSPSAFRQNQSGQLGNLGRNVVIGPGFKGVDLALSKAIRISERKQIQLRCDAFNAFNWVNLGQPTGSLASVNFGRILSANDPRIFQLGLKFMF
jgi:Carboxypeptidase regulatory-like domain